MEKRHFPLCVFKTISVALVLEMSISACAVLPGVSGTSWKAEALLHDGSKIVVTRSVDRGGRHEIGQSPPYKRQSLQFSMPSGGRTIKWEDRLSDDVGMVNFLPMLLDTKDGIAYLVTSPVGCLSYNKWGRPNPPYIIFKNDEKTWKRIPLKELPSEIKDVNLISSEPDVEVEKSGKRFMSAEMIKAIIASYEQPEHRTIVREKVKNGSSATACREEYPDGHGGWLGADWFRHSTKEECAQFCDRKRITTDFCKCFITGEGK